MATRIFFLSGLVASDDDEAILREQVECLRVAWPRTEVSVFQLPRQNWALTKDVLAASTSCDGCITTSIAAPVLSKISDSTDLVELVAGALSLCSRGAFVAGDTSPIATLERLTELQVTFLGQLVEQARVWAHSLLQEIIIAFATAPPSSEDLRIHIVAYSTGSLALQQAVRLPGWQALPSDCLSADIFGSPCTPRLPIRSTDWVHVGDLVPATFRQVEGALPDACSPCPPSLTCTRTVGSAADPHPHHIGSYLSHFRAA
eukprot:CAMPEP_0177660998 /NCGR_PEP_ID=MMETSP0447-20121125/18392_1 /TAXON_ID=0 /ORGANISM="Stygamoeba regulata, Strain BSH-02190019" /LENGTH=259 /DNA_ID=CAMNT_0019166207 /DNA_START=267 /DNA_END=1042 /DNA_ORIENTATION=-